MTVFKTSKQHENSAAEGGRLLQKVLRFLYSHCLEVQDKNLHILSISSGTSFFEVQLCIEISMFNEFQDFFEFPARLLLGSQKGCIILVLRVLLLLFLASRAKAGEAFWSCWHTRCSPVKAIFLLRPTWGRSGPFQARLEPLQGLRIKGYVGNEIVERITFLLLMCVFLIARMLILNGPVGGSFC